MSETANEPPQDEGSSLNSPRNLAMEATYINHNFSQQCLRMVCLCFSTVNRPLMWYVNIHILFQTKTFVSMHFCCFVFREERGTSFPILTRLLRRTWRRVKWHLLPTGMCWPLLIKKRNKERKMICDSFWSVTFWLLIHSVTVNFCSPKMDLFTHFDAVYTWTGQKKTDFSMNPFL